MLDFVFAGYLQIVQVAKDSFQVSNMLAAGTCEMRAGGRV
jgi:hypothetical protein